MTVRDLDRNQLIELKQNILCNREENASYGELADVDELISDEEVFEEYDGVIFTPDDFFCTIIT